MATISRRTFLRGSIAVAGAAAAAGLLRRDGARAQAPPLAVHSGRLFDGTGADPVPDAVVLIEAGRVVAAGPAAEIAVSPYAARLDARGGFIMPGVIDNHVHVTQQLAAEQDILTDWLRAGVTTLVDVGTLPNFVQPLRDLAVQVAATPPRLFVAGPILTAPEGYPSVRPFPQNLAAGPLTGPADARATVAALIDDEGADVIKVAIETGFTSDYDEPGWPVLDRDTLRAVTETAHERGRLVRAHISQEGELRAALDTGVDIAAHTPIDPVSDEVLEDCAAAGMIFITTANIWGDAEAARNAARYLQLGGRIALGTDFPFQQGSSMPEAEFALLARSGVSVRDLLVAATKGGGEALGRPDLGTLTPGSVADVIVIDGDPLIDLPDIANVAAVVLGGEVITGDVTPGAPTPTAPATATPAATRTPAPLVLPDTGAGPSAGSHALAVLGPAGLAAGALLTCACALRSRRRRETQ